MSLPDLIRSNRSLFSDFFRELDELFARTALSGGSRDFARASMDVEEEQDRYILSFDMPGVRKEDVKVDVSGGVLTVFGERQVDLKEGRGRRERQYGCFQRSLTLPQGTKAEDIKAHYENGVLEIILPKAELQKRQTIQIDEGRADRKPVQGERQGQKEGPAEQASKH